MEATIVQSIYDGNRLVPGISRIITLGIPHKSKYRRRTIGIYEETVTFYPGKARVSRNN